MRLFVIKPCGDPYSRAWDVIEYENGDVNGYGVFRGDLSGMYRKAQLKHVLQRLYNCCVIRVEA